MQQIPLPQPARVMPANVMRRAWAMARVMAEAKGTRAAYCLRACLPQAWADEKKHVAYCFALRVRMYLATLSTVCIIRANKATAEERYAPLFSAA